MKIILKNAINLAYRNLSNLFGQIPFSKVEIVDQSIYEIDHNSLQWIYMKVQICAT